MVHHCFRCKKGVMIVNPAQVGRRDSCDSCGSDLHCCKNCVHFDSKAYNSCREPSAERVVEKEKSNFCDFFHFRKSSPDGSATSDSDGAAAHRKKLDDLFK